MKWFVLCFAISMPVFAQLPDMKSLTKQVMEACKEDKSKVEGCDSYTELKPLKECLMKNEKKLSEKCKTSLKLVP